MQTPEIFQGFSEITRTVTSVGIVGVFGFLWRLDRRVARVEQTLTGVDGKNGLVSKVGDLHKWRNDFQEREIELVREENRRLQARLDHQKEES